MYTHTPLCYYIQSNGFHECSILNLITSYYAIKMSKGISSYQFLYKVKFKNRLILILLIHTIKFTSCYWINLRPITMQVFSYGTRYNETKKEYAVMFNISNNNSYS